MSRKTRPILDLDAQGRALQSSSDWTTFRGEYSGTNLIYAARARVGADESESVWQIFKCEYDGSNNLLSIKWPENSEGVASKDFVFSYTDRASYTYA